MGSRDAAGTAAVVSACIVLLAGCGTGQDVPVAVSVTGTGDGLRLDCGGRDAQSAQVALAEGSGLPDPAAAVEDAQATGWLPAGRADLLDGPGRGVVRDDGQVAAVYVLEDVGDGWYVTSVETCGEERRP